MGKTQKQLAWLPTAQTVVSPVISIMISSYHLVSWHFEACKRTINWLFLTILRSKGNGLLHTYTFGRGFNCRVNVQQCWCWQCQQPWDSVPIFSMFRHQQFDRWCFFRSQSFNPGHTSCSAGSDQGLESARDKGCQNHPQRSRIGAVWSQSHGCQCSRCNQETAGSRPGLFSYTCERIFKYQSQQ